MQDISASEPIILPSSILDQIPLGVQPVDLASLKATELDHGPQYYPDKLLPTITLLQGQEPSLGNGQTIYTDGNHRLLVSSSDSGGVGGGTPVALKYFDAQVLDVDGNTNVRVNFGPLHILYRMQTALTLFEVDTPQARDAWCLWYLIPHGHPVQDGALIITQTMPYGTSYNGSVIPPVAADWSYGWDIATSLNNPSGMWDLLLQGGAGRIDGWAVIQCT